MGSGGREVVCLSVSACLFEANSYIYYNFSLPTSLSCLDNVPDLVL